MYYFTPRVLREHNYTEFLGKMFVVQWFHQNYKLYCINHYIHQLTLTKHVMIWHSQTTIMNINLNAELITL